jgi:Transcription factor WhiB
MTTIAGRRPDVDLPTPAADGSLWIQVISSARCAESVLDPDGWFPVSPKPEIARFEADTAIVICMACPVRALCLELSLRHWDIGQHGIWGGLVPAGRARLRRRWPARQGMSQARPRAGR